MKRGGKRAGAGRKPFAVECRHLLERIAELEACLRFTRDVGMNASKINKVLGHEAATHMPGTR